MNKKLNDRAVFDVVVGIINLTLPVVGFVHFVNNLIDDSYEGNAPYIISGVIGLLLSAVLFLVYFAISGALLFRFLIIAYGHVTNFIMLVANKFNDVAIDSKWRIAFYIVYALSYVGYIVILCVLKVF